MRIIPQGLTAESRVSRILVADRSIQRHGVKTPSNNIVLPQHPVSSRTDNHGPNTSVIPEFLRRNRPERQRRRSGEGRNPERLPRGYLFEERQNRWSPCNKMQSE
jgi:ribosomal protein L34E